MTEKTPQSMATKNSRPLPISAVIITYNEAQNIVRCLRSLNWVAEIVVVDSGSTDRTVELCRQFGCRTIHSQWLGFGPTKRLAVEQAHNHWVLSIDADEEITPELQIQITELFQPQPPLSGYFIRRISFYLEQEIRYSGWNNDYPLRLFDRRYGNFNTEIVHESVILQGEKGRLTGPLRHYPYPTVSDHIRKMNIYSTLTAERDLKKGKSSTLIGALLRCWIKFFKMYILQAGFLDGPAGFVLAINSAFGVYLKYLKIWQSTH